jgi:hypothetical protein
MVASSAEAAERMLVENFGEFMRGVRRDIQLTCVDITPVFEYQNAASKNELNALLRRTPVTLPFPAVIFGGTFPATDVWPESDPHARCIVFVECQRWNKRQNLLACREIPGEVQLDDNSRGFFVQMNQDGTIHDSVDGKYPGVGKMPQLDRISSPGIIETVLCALAMFHVRNIGTRPQQFPRTIRRRLAKDGLEGPHVYRTLTLRPFASEDRNGGRRMQTGDRPLHLVRGHFARYTVNRPLFGKYDGLFWRPEHEAGNPAVAVIRKRYQFDMSAS